MSARPSCWPPPPSTRCCPRGKANEALRIDRRIGAVGYARQPAPGEYRAEGFVNEGMALFNLLTRSPVRPRPTGRWSSISTLGGIIGAGHDRTLSHEGTAGQFQGRCDALAAAWAGSRTAGAT